MRKIFSDILLIAFFTGSVFLVSCGNEAEEEKKEEVKNEQKIRDSIHLSQILPKNYEEFNSDAGGPAGVYQVPEMLTLCIKDSASAQKMAEAFSSAYRNLLKDLEEADIKPNGAPGSIYYNNDPNNFKFECIYPIGKMPKKTPKRSQVVVLEACNMYIYNYYGPYGDLYKAYESIRTDLNRIGLNQTGPMREFYITAESSEKDSSKWLTRIMVPVMPKK